MQRFERYADFLESNYRHWVPDYAEQHDQEPTTDVLNTPCVLYAYTDYGGDFLDRVICQFLYTYGNDRILWQNTRYNGMNVLYIGNLPDDGYPLNGFLGIDECLEDYYMELEFKAYSESFDYFLEDVFGARTLLKRWGKDQLIENKYGYYAPQPDGTVDFCYSTLRDWLLSQPRHSK